MMGEVGEVNERIDDGRAVRISSPAKILLELISRIEEVHAVQD